jgi:hypothetical protein
VYCLASATKIDMERAPSSSRTVIKKNIVPAQATTSSAHCSHLMLVVAALALSSLQTIFASNSGELRRSFAQHYPEGEKALASHLLARHEWSSLETYDRTRQEQVTDQIYPLGPVIQCPAQLLHSYGPAGAAGAGAGGAMGGNKICVDIPEKNCLIFKYDSRHGWDFEKAILKSHPSCQIHTFDCYSASSSSSGTVTIPQELKESVSSHRMCISSKDEHVGGKEMLTWSSLLKKLDVNVAPTALKIDIEGYEWSVLREMMRSSPIALLPQTISVRLYVRTPHSQLGWSARERNPSETALFVEQMMKYGYFLVDKSARDSRERVNHLDLVFSRIGETAIHRGKHHHT